MFNPLRTRKGRLQSKIESEFLKDNPDLNVIISSIEDYEKDNLKTIEKLRRSKTVEMKKINGALKQSIDAHGPITKELIGSASKRIHGALLDNIVQPTFFPLSLRSILIGVLISSIIFIVLLAL